MSNLRGGSPLNPIPATPQQQPVQLQAGSQSFFKALLSPFRGTAAHVQNDPSSSGFEPPVHVTAPAPLSEDSGVHCRGRSPNMAATRTLYGRSPGKYDVSSAVTPVPMLQLPQSFDTLPSFLRRSSAASSNHVNESATASGGDALWLPPHHRSSPPPSTAIGEGVDNSSFASVSSTSSSSFLKSLSGHNLYTKALALRPVPKRPIAQLTDEHPSISTGFISPPTQPGLCAPQMVGYRQCLEVNPDMKKNCTWALDRYMQCQEDAQL